MQLGQAEELLAGPANTTLPTVVVCDCNSNAHGAGSDATARYGLLIASGLTDAWTIKRPRAPGFTCCQAADLSNARSSLAERIGLVLVRGDVDVVRARVTGARPAERTPRPARLWASDHAGVVATLRLPRIPR